MNRHYGLAAFIILVAAPATARTLLVGPDRDYKLPSEAFAAAHDGDTVSIAPGEYVDCAIVHANHLTIQGEDGPSPAAMTDKVCEEKAILVLRGNGTTIRNLTLQRARVPDDNGAGIRLESPDLSVDHVHFLNDQVGILSGTNGGTITVTDSQFDRGGVGGPKPRYALMIGHSAHLTVTSCRFRDVKGGQIITAASISDIVDDQIAIGAGDPEEDPSYAVLATDGALTMDRDIITAGPVMPRPGAAIGIWDDATATIGHTELVNQIGTSLTLLEDWTWGTPTLHDNVISAGDSLTSSSGVWRHRASSQYYERKEQAHILASQAKQMLKHLLGR